MSFTAATVDITSVLIKSCLAISEMNPTVRFSSISMLSSSMLIYGTVNTDRVLSGREISRTIPATSDLAVAMLGQGWK